MHSPSYASSEQSQDSTGSCGRNSDSLYRTTSKGSSVSIFVGTDQQSKIRYGGRGGAASRPRLIPPAAPIVETVTKARNFNLPESQAANFKSKWLQRAPSVDGLRIASANAEAPPPVPDMPPQLSIAGRRGTARIPGPIVVPPTPIQQPHPSVSTTPPLSASHSSTPDGETPRTPYFYFDDAFDASSRVQSPLPSPRSPSTMSRSLRRIASRTQEFFTKTRSRALRVPPSTPVLPDLPSSSSSSVRDEATRSSSSHSPSPSRASLTSEWYDSSDVPPSPEPFLADPNRPRTPSIPIIVALSPTPGGRARSASSATVKVRRHKHKEKALPRNAGDWNRDDMGEVIVALRMLK
ncbi:hypothetical protein R3P38DRAFT_3270755 [Favolaschia claudopus]|uniref:Uncharacterized protein n=1 Tax=Favolaschia claudopus TaxID=2862362 RepID=A0AAW0BE62_9AGAR